MTSQLEEEIAALRSQLQVRDAETAAKESQLERYAADLRETFKEERQRSQQLRASYMATVRALASAVEARDAYTSKHAERVAAYGLELARALGLALGDHPEIEFGFLLHDVGKVAIPDAILFKPRPLDREERLVMERHPEIGEQILREIEFLGPAKEVVRHHHERWDGHGYPDGLAGESIPIAARVFAVADALDALTTTRPYRPAVAIPRARQIIVAESGRQFDPSVIAAFESLRDERIDEMRSEIGVEQVRREAE
jgi:ribonuclease P protein subunit RPR2